MKNQGSILTESQEHWVALLDYNASTDMFYVSDPNVNNSDLYNKGWISRDALFKGCIEYVIIGLEKDNTAPSVVLGNAIGAMDESIYDKAVSSESFASAKVKEDNEFSSGADILTLAGCDGKVASFIAISNTGEFIKHNTSKEISYESVIKLPTIYSIAAYNETASADIKNKNSLNEISITFGNTTKILPVRPIRDAIADTLIHSDNFEYSRLCQVYIGQNNHNDNVQWLREPTDLGYGDKVSYYSNEANDQDVSMGGAVWGSGTILRPIRWMYAIVTNELNVDKYVYDIIMNYASQCATGGMPEKTGYTIYHKTGSGKTIHGHDIGIVVNNSTRDFYIYAIMVENDANDPTVCTNVANAIFNVMEGFINNTNYEN